MKFHGLLLKESINDLNILNLFSITKTEVWNNVQNAIENQPKKWTAIYFKFEGTEDEANIKASKVSKALKIGLWYGNFFSDDSIYVIYPKSKFFKYSKGDKKKLKEAIDYGVELGIPLSQLDWES